MISPVLTISVLISTYNRADLLPEALDSLLAQTRVPDEIVVVDDGSTDNTLDVLKRYGAPVRVISQKNRGLPAARNVGLQAATGDLIAFLDSDDTLPLTSIAKRAEYLELHPNVMAVYGATHMTNLHNQFLGWFRPLPLPEGNLFAESICRVVFPMHSILLRRTCIQTVGLFDESLRVQLDLDYWIRFSAVYPIKAIQDVVAYYRVHDGMSVQTQIEEVIRKGVQVRERAFSMPEFAVLTSREKAHTYNVHATQLIKLNEIETARWWYIRAIRTAPLYLLSYLLFTMSVMGKSVRVIVFNLRRVVLNLIKKRL